MSKDNLNYILYYLLFGTQVVDLDDLSFLIGYATATNTVFSDVTKTKIPSTYIKNTFDYILEGS